MLQIIFGDDEHTASDGPYVRVLKTRKWLYITSIAALIVANGLYIENAAQEIIKVIKLPHYFLKHSILVGIAYLTVQYILLIAQLVSTYDIVLAERFTSRRADELATARKAENDARQKYEMALKSFESNQDAAKRNLRETVLKEIEVGKINLDACVGDAAENEYRPAGSQALRQARYEVSRLRGFIAGRKHYLKKLDDASFIKTVLIPEYDPTVQSTNMALLEASSALSVLQKQEPSMRYYYKILEIAIDVVRVLLPAILAIVAFITLMFFDNRSPT